MLVAQRRRPPEVPTKFRTRKYLRCVFRDDVAHQWKLAWCSTVKRNASIRPIVRKLHVKDVGVSDQ